MPFFEGDTAVEVFEVYREEETAAGPPGPVTDPSGVEVKLIDPDDVVLDTYTLDAGVQNLGGGKYRVEFPAPTGPGRYALWARIVGPLPYRETITLRQGMEVTKNGSLV